MPHFVTIPKRAAAVLSVVVAIAIALIMPTGASAAAHLALHNPSHNCDPGQVNYLKVSIRNVNRCRRREHLGPLRLPSNYHRLKPAERILVLINLARVNRGLPPVVGLSRSLNALAGRGARAQADPRFPSHGFSGGGSLWAYAFGLMGAQLGWMYDDGWGRYVTNSACSSPSAWGCWVHRDIILMTSQRRLVAGGAVHKIRIPGMRNAHSYAFEILAGYSTRHLTFRWKHELKYFKRRPRIERLRRRR